MKTLLRLRLSLVCQTAALEQGKLLRASQERKPEQPSTQQSSLEDEARTAALQPKGAAEPNSNSEAVSYKTASLAFYFLFLSRTLY